MPTKLTLVEVLATFKRVHGERYDYSLTVYRGSGAKVQVVCRDHGPFEVLPGHHSHGVGCRLCYFEGSRNGRTLFIDRSTELYGSRFDYGKVSNALKTTEKVRIRCNVHDQWFNQLASAHMKGHAGCSECRSSKLSGPAHQRGAFKSDKHLQADFLARAAAVHGNTYIYVHFFYQGAVKKGAIVCPEHGRFLQTPSNHLRGSGCPECAVEAKHRDSFKAKCKELGIDYWSALKRRKAGMSEDNVMKAVSLRSERRTNPITIHNVTYPNMESAVRHLNPIASTPTIFRWIAKGVAPEDAFVGVPNPGYEKGVIYMVEHVPTGRQYIGLTIVPLQDRWQGHTEQAKAGHIKSLYSLHAAIRMYGEGEFTIQIIDRGTTKLDLERKERYWITRLRTLVPKGFNISPGGGSGGSMGRVTFVDGHKFYTVREAATFIARARGITLEAAKGRLRSGRLDVVTPSKPGQAVSKIPAYKSWSRIVHCVTNSASKNFIPGIELHPGWSDFHCFLKEVGQPSVKGQMFARLDKSKGFTPDNCAWMGRSEASQINAAHMKANGTLVGRRRKTT